MNSKRLLILFVLAVWCIIDIMNFVVSMHLYKCGQYIYPAIFGGFYCFEKCAILIAIIIQRQKTSIRFALLDMVSLGLVTTFTNDIKMSRIQTALLIKAISRGVLFYIQMILFFGVKLLQNVNDQYVIDIGYASYLLYLITQGITFELVSDSSYYLSLSSSQLSSQNITKVKMLKSLVSTMVYNVTLSGMVSIGSGYYFLIITAFQHFLLLLKSNLNHINEDILKHLIVNIIFNNPGYHHHVHIKKWFTILDYICQLIRFILFAIYVDYTHTHTSHLDYINNITTTTLNTIYFIYFIKSFYKQTFKVTIIYINQISDFENIYKQFKAGSFYSYTKFNLFFNTNIVCEPLKQVKENTLTCTDTLCQKYYDFNKIILDKESAKFKFQVSNFPQLYCQYHVKDSLKTMKKIDYWIYFQLEKYVFSNLLYPIVFDRYYNGYIQNSNNSNLFNYFKTTPEKKVFLQLEQDILQINAYKKQLEKIIINTPTLVLYDLYYN